jgi:hypothetical protein
MILDKFGKEINTGDHCYVPFNNELHKIQIIKETRCRIYYEMYIDARSMWTNLDYHMIKTGKPANNLVKIC